MPQKEHLPSVSNKEQRMYEHIKASEKEQGRSTERAKAIAAADGREASQRGRARQAQVIGSAPGLPRRVDWSIRRRCHPVQPTSVARPVRNREALFVEPT